MTLAVRITSNNQEPQRFLRALSRGGVQRATSRALNKTAKQVKTASSKGIRKERNLKARTVNKQLGIQRSNPRKLEAAVTATGSSIPLKEYGARQVKGGVSVKVTNQRETIKGAFIVPSLGGHVFRRRGKSRLPIDKLYGPSLPSAFIKARVEREMRSKARGKYPRIYAHELEREIEKAGRRAHARANAQGQALLRRVGGAIVRS